jgi:hypothetical protein
MTLEMRATDLMRARPLDLIVRGPPRLSQAFSTLGLTRKYTAGDVGADAGIGIGQRARGERRLAEIEQLERCGLAPPGARGLHVGGELLDDAAVTESRERGARVVPGSTADARP